MVGVADGESSPPVSPREPPAGGVPASPRDSGVRTSSGRQ